MDDLTPHQILFLKALKLGYPPKINGYKVIYDFKNYEVDFAGFVGQTEKKN